MQTSLRSAVWVCLGSALFCCVGASLSPHHCPSGSRPFSTVPPWDRHVVAASSSSWPDVKPGSAWGQSDLRLALLTAQCTAPVSNVQVRVRRKTSETAASVMFCHAPFFTSCTLGLLLKTLLGVAGAGTGGASLPLPVWLVYSTYPWAAP